MKLKHCICAIAFCWMIVGCSGETEPKVAMSEAPAAIDEADESLESQIESAVLIAEKKATASFIPATFEPPVLVETDTFKIVPLGPDLVEVDFEAYMSSIDHLQKTFTRSTSWPHKDITDADALLDMQTEQARFENRESFAYAILTPDGKRERGCIYVYPSTVDGYDAVVRMWVTQSEFDAGFDEVFYSWAQQWLEADWPFKAVAYPGRSVAWDQWDSLVADSADKAAQQLASNQMTAEGFIDAFYSFDKDRLQAYLDHAPESAPRILYYQGWAEGGNYIVLNRGACESESPTSFNCPITVQDDPVVALKTGFNVTDTFHITFAGVDIVEVKTSSNDQPIYYEARKWVEANMPEVMAGPCLDRNKGGTTPGDCARAMTEGYKQFYATTQTSEPSP